MRIKILALGLVCLFIFSISFGQNQREEFGELEELVLQQFPRSFKMKALTSEEAAAQVKALAVGMSQYKPTMYGGSVDFDYYDWYSSYSVTRYLCFVVVNNSEKAVKMKVKLEMFYNDGKNVFSRIWTKTIGEDRVILYYTKTDIIKKIGLYTLRGKLYDAKGLGNTNEVVTHFYIYEY